MPFLLLVNLASLWGFSRERLPEERGAFFGRRSRDFRVDQRARLGGQKLRRGAQRERQREAIVLLADIVMVQHKTTVVSSTGWLP